MNGNSGKKRDFSSTVAGAQVIFGIIIFTSAWWVGDSYRTAFYIYGFFTVILGIITSISLTSRRK